jgi:hypothetical protein
MTWLIALRFVMSIGLGAEIVVGGGMLVEFAPTLSRGRIVAMLGLCSAFGAIAANLGNYLITHTGRCRTGLAARSNQTRGDVRRRARHARKLDQSVRVDPVGDCKLARRPSPKRSVRLPAGVHTFDVAFNRHSPQRYPF